MRRHRLWIDGAHHESAEVRPIFSPFTGQIVAECDQADATLLDRAIAAMASASEGLSSTSRYARSRLLAEMGKAIARRRDEFVEVIVDEAGKPKPLAEAEVSRALTTFAIGSDETKRFGGEVFPLDVEAAGRAYEHGISYFVPRGPVLGITPFNFPLNLVAHKVVPALAVGAPILVKPAPQAPGAACLLAEAFQEAAREASDSRDRIPMASLQVVSASNDVATHAVQDRRISTLSFTGSAAVGWMLQGLAKGKKVLLELGGNAAVIVHEDGDLDRAAARCTFGAFAYAGQVCISVQHIFAHERIYDRFRSLLLSETQRVQSGDPRGSDTLAGPLIDEAAVTRVLSWIDEAREQGARVLAGGSRDGPLVLPTILEGVPEEATIAREEAFGPVVLLSPYTRFSEAVAAVNRSRYGLQAGVFTDQHSIIREASAALSVGCVLINEVPIYRADHMPYGGVKDSGLGREGVRYAMEEYSERKTVIVWKG